METVKMWSLSEFYKEFAKNISRFNEHLLFLGLIKIVE